MRELRYICTTKDNEVIETTSYALAERIKAEGGSYKIHFVNIKDLMEGYER